MSHFDCQYFKRFGARKAVKLRKRKFLVYSIVQHRNIKVSAKYQKSQKSVWLYTLMWNTLLKIKLKNLSFYFKSFIVLTLAETVLMSHVEKKSFLFKSVVLQAK